MRSFLNVWKEKEKERRHACHFVTCSLCAEKTHTLIIICYALVGTQYSRSIIISQNHRLRLSWIEWPLFLQPPICGPCQKDISFVPKQRAPNHMRQRQTWGGSKDMRASFYTSSKFETNQCSLLICNTQIYTGLDITVRAIVVGKLYFNFINYIFVNRRL